MENYFGNHYFSFYEYSIDVQSNSHCYWCQDNKGNYNSRRSSTIILIVFLTPDDIDPDDYNNHYHLVCDSCSVGIVFMIGDDVMDTKFMKTLPSAINLANGYCFTPIERMFDSFVCIENLNLQLPHSQDDWYGAYGYFQERTKHLFFENVLVSLIKGETNHHLVLLDTTTTCMSYFHNNKFP